MNIKNELLIKYLLRLSRQPQLSRTELNYGLSKNYPELEREKTLRKALLNKFIKAQPSLSDRKVGRSTTYYLILDKGVEFLNESLKGVGKQMTN